MGTKKDAFVATYNANDQNPRRDERSNRRGYATLNAAHPNIAYLVISKSNRLHPLARFHTARK
jgi:hypothetical protein